jgi:HD-like signal output (HDOD) protein
MTAKVKAGEIRVPPSPIAALRLMQLLSDERTPVSTLTGVLGQDQSLAAIVLRLANSVKYRRLSEVVSLSDAVLVLGRSALRDVSVAKELHERTLSAGALVALRRRAWRESVVAAQVAAWVAPMFGAKTDDAFIAGLLHDIGRVPAISLLEDLLMRSPTAPARREDAWWQLVEAHHVELGGTLAQAWGLPSLVRATIAQHHLPHETSALLDALRVADEVVKLMDGAPFVSVERLGAIAELSTAQCLELAEQLPLLPETLDAFREPQQKERFDVISYELSAADATVAGRVALTWEGLVTQVEVVAMSEVELTVSKTLSVGRVVAVQAGEARFHARVTGCVGEVSTLRPWGLDQRQANEWAAVVAQASAARAA